MNYKEYSNERLLFLRREKEKELNDIKIELSSRNIRWWEM